MGIARQGLAAAAMALALGVLAPPEAGAMPLGRMGDTGSTTILPAQWVYGRYGRPYRAGPYARGYWARRRFDANHFGPGAAKERHRTRLDYCISKPERC